MGRSVTCGSGNVFADIGVPNREEHMVKADVVMLIARLIEQHGLTQTAAARRIGLSQPDLSRLLKGQFRGYTEQLDVIDAMMQWVKEKLPES